MCSLSFRWNSDSFIFFFSSRRRHTRLQGDWSSDVCSSDLDDNSSSSHKSFSCSLSRYATASLGSKSSSFISRSISSSFDPLTARPKSSRRRSEEHTSELQSPCNLVCRLLLEKKKKINSIAQPTALHHCHILALKVAINFQNLIRSLR